MACRIIDLFAPGAGIALEAADAAALIAVRSILFCVVSLERFRISPTFIPCMSSCTYHVLNIML
jgi:hypothetical protein